MSEIEEKKESKQEPSIKRFDTVIAFLAVELIGLVLFGFGGVFGLKFLQLIAIFLAFLAFPFLSHNIDSKTMKANAKWLIPLAAFALLGSVSAFFFVYYGGPAGMFSFILYSLLQFLGILAFFVLGASIRYIEPLKREFIIYGLLGALGLYVLLVTLYSLARYGFFYAARYDGMVYYYDGVLFRIAREGKALMGFSFSEVTIAYAGTPAFILAASGCGLFALKPKEEKIKFIVVGSLALLGILSLAFMPHKLSLLVLLAVYAVMGLLRLVHYFRQRSEIARKKWDFALKIAFFVLIGMVGIGLILLFIETKTGLLAKIGLVKEGNFFGRIVVQIEDVLYNGSANKPFLSASSILFGYHPTTLTVHLERIYEFNVLWQNGVPAFLLMVYLIFFFIKKQRDYLFEGKDTLGEKFVFIALILAIFIRFSLFDDEMPLIHASEQAFIPFLSSNMHYALMALLGLTYVPMKAKEKEVVVHE